MLPGMAPHRSAYGQVFVRLPNLNADFTSTSVACCWLEPNEENDFWSVYEEVYVVASMVGLIFGLHYYRLDDGLCGLWDK